MSQFRFTSECTDQCELKIEPIPGARNFPRRTVCPIHGYPSEKHSKFNITSQSEPEKYNNYVMEIASPADVIEIGGKEISIY